MRMERSVAGADSIRQFGCKMMNSVPEDEYVHTEEYAQYAQDNIRKEPNANTKQPKYPPKNRAILSETVKASCGISSP
jgi:hypothetical protein